MKKSQAKLKLVNDRAVRIFEILAEQNPNPQTELTHTNDFTLLVAVILSAQTTDKQVNKSTANLFRKVFTPSDLLEYGEDNLIAELKSIGLYRTKVRNIIAMSQQLIALHNSKVPQNREALESLPGVGKKTAAVILNCAFGKPTIAVDTHVFRVAQRLGLSTEKAADKLEVTLTKKLSEILKTEILRNVHHWLILHGRYICTARNPKCGECKISHLCPHNSTINSE